MQGEVTMIVLAAGRGRRFGGPLPKQYMPLRNRPVLWHALCRLHSHTQVGSIVPVIAPDGEELWQEIMVPLLDTLPKVAAPVAGGDERQHSVFKALRALTLAEDAWVGIHDGARPLVDPDMMARLFQARQVGDAILPVMPARDTLKRLDPRGHVVETLDRESVRLAQTPQLFRFGLIFRAHQQAAARAFLGTDDASLVECMQGTTRFSPEVVTVDGSANTFKITQSLDRDLAELLLQTEERA